MKEADANDGFFPRLHSVVYRGLGPIPASPPISSSGGVKRAVIRGFSIRKSLLSVAPDSSPLTVAKTVPRRPPFLVR